MSRDDQEALGGPTVASGEQLTAESVHERQRRAITALIPGWYNPWVHLSIPTAIGIALVIATTSQIHALRLVELLAIPASLLLTFLFEWNAHKYVLHRRSPLVGIIYERHELQHHVIYTHEDMAMRSRREFWLILVPAYAIVLIFVIACPLAFALSWLLSPNVGYLFLATAMVFFVSYEWLHLAYHLPPESAIGRLRVIAFLREHHRLHHDPRLMQKWNFNVTVPVFDWIFRTNWSKEREAERAEKRASRKRPRASPGPHGQSPHPRPS
jgi:hypothetical protein